MACMGCTKRRTLLMEAVEDLRKGDFAAYKEKMLAAVSSAKDDIRGLYKLQSPDDLKK